MIINGLDPQDQQNIDLNNILSQQGSRTSSYTQQTLLLLHGRPEHFYLTGSRFFGGVRRRSDFDLFTARDASLEAWMGSENFNDYGSDPNYLDALTHTVYLRDDVHVQICKDVGLKKNIQRMLGDSGLMSILSKSARYRVWALVVNTALGIGLNPGKVTVQTRIDPSLFCSCSGPKVQRSVGNDTYMYCQGCKKEYKP